MTNRQTTLPALKSACSFDMEVMKTTITPETRDTPGSVPNLPLDLILLVFDSYPLDKILPLSEIGALKEILVVRLNNETSLRSRHLEYISKHPEICARLKKLDVLCTTEKDVVLLESICKWCSNLEDLTLELDGHCLIYLKECRQILRALGMLTATIAEGEDILWLNIVCQRCPNVELKLEISNGLLNLRKCQPILERLTELRAINPQMEDLLSLEDVCKRYPKNIQNIEIWLFGSSLAQPLSQYSEILKRLTCLDVRYPNADDLSSLRAICKRYPMKLNLRAPVYMKELKEYREILESLGNLTVVYPVGEEDLDWLNDICRLSPNISKLKFEMKGGLQRLVTCSHVLAPLSSMSVCLLDKDNCSLFKELCQQCPKLQDYKIKSRRHFSKYLTDYPMVRSITMFGDQLTINGAESKQGFKMNCEFQHLYDLAEFMDLQALTELELTLTGDENDDDIAKFPLLEDISLRSPSLEKLAIHWESTRSSMQLAGFLGKAMKNWESLYKLVIVCPQQLELMLRRKWANAGVDLVEIAEWRVTK